MLVSAAALAWQTCRWSFGPTSCDEPFARQKWTQKEAAKALSIEPECGMEARSAEAAREKGPPMSISDIPLAWVKGEDRKALCEQLFTQGFLSDFAGLRQASSPHFRALRRYAKSCFRSCAHRLHSRV